MTLSKATRRVLDGAGLPGVQILVSGNLDEYLIEEYLSRGAPIDAFGVGTRMDVSADAPYLDMAYKLVRYAGRDVLKVSTGKETWAGEKQVYRRRDPSGRSVGDVIARRDEPPVPGAEPLLQQVMTRGQPVAHPPSLDAVRARCAASVGELPEPVRRLRDGAPYPVGYSDALRAVQQALTRRVKAAGPAGPAPAGATPAAREC